MPLRPNARVHTPLRLLRLSAIHMIFICLNSFLIFLYQVVEMFSEAQSGYFELEWLLV